MPFSPRVAVRNSRSSFCTKASAASSKGFRSRASNCRALANSPRFGQMVVAPRYRAKSALLGSTSTGMSSRRAAGIIAWHTSGVRVPLA